MKNQGWMKLWHRDDVEGNEDIQSLIEKIDAVISLRKINQGWCYINDVATYWFISRPNSPNPPWFAAVDLAKEVARLLPKAYGELTFIDDEGIGDELYQISREFEQLYRVYILQDGKLTHHIHPYLSLEIELNPDYDEASDD